MIQKSKSLWSNYKPIVKLNDYVYKISWDPQNYIVHMSNKDITTSSHCTYVYEIVNFKPSLDYIKNLIIDYYNKQVDEKILTGFIWRDMPVWLSSENEFNYKAAYDLAVQTNGATLPIKFKFGDTLNPIYYEFTTLEDFRDFYTSAIQYINNCLSEGWQKKDSIDWDQYIINEE